MAGQIQCGNCKTMVPDGSTLSDDKRTPCPKCGSKARISNVQVSCSVGVSATATATVITYPQSLLTLARSFIDEGHFQMATIVCHMACEIAAERALSAGFAAREIPDLEEPIEKLLNGYNMGGNDRLRKLYTALTKDEIQNEPFWAEYKASGERRNAIVHRGASVDKPAAEKSFAAATSFVGHLKQ